MPRDINYIDNPASMYREPYVIFHRRIVKNIGNSISEAGLSQRLQTLAGLNPRYILKIKRGDKNITLKTIWKICQATGVNPKNLFE